MGLQIRFCLKMCFTINQKKKKSLKTISGSRIFFFRIIVIIIWKKNHDNVAYCCFDSSLLTACRDFTILLALFHYFPHRGIYSDDNEFQNKPNEMCIFIGLCVPRTNKHWFREPNYTATRREGCPRKGRHSLHLLALPGTARRQTSRPALLMHSTLILLRHHLIISI